MKERPILFSAPMVRALLAGTKTQTRRVLGLPSLRPSTTPGYDWTWRGQAPIRSVAQQARHPRGCWQDVSHAELLDLCPYGAPGDRLWVREAWTMPTSAQSVYYRADYPSGNRPLTPREPDYDSINAWAARYRVDGWHPSIHMPRWASRLSLEITSVRVERVQSISEEDARAEGVDALGGRAGVSDARGAFCALWDSINGEREGCSWSANPWVWVVGFKRLEVRRG